MIIITGEQIFFSISLLWWVIDDKKRADQSFSSLFLGKSLTQSCKYNIVKVVKLKDEGWPEK